MTKEDRAAYAKKYYRENKEKFSRRSKDQYQRHKEEELITGKPSGRRISMNKAKRDYYHRHKDKPENKERRKSYNLENKERIQAYMKKYRSTNPNKTK